MAASSAYAVADTFGWPAGLSEQPWQAEGFYIVLTASLLVGLAFALLRIDPIKLSFYANVFTGVLARRSWSFISWRSAIAARLWENTRLAG